MGGLYNGAYIMHCLIPRSAHHTLNQLQKSAFAHPFFVWHCCERQKRLTRGAKVEFFCFVTMNQVTMLKTTGEIRRYKVMPIAQCSTEGVSDIKTARTLCISELLQINQYLKS